VLGRLPGELEVVLRQLPRRLHGLTAAGGEEDPVEVARRVAGDALGEVDRARVGIGPQRVERELGRLLRGHVGQPLAAVADLGDEEAGEAVEVALALGVVDVGALATGDDGDVGLVVGGHPREVHPQVVPGGALQVLVALGFHGHILSCRNERCK
jgi:hypothetical protein